MNTTSFYRIAVASTVSALTLAFATSAVPAQASSAVDVQDWAVLVDPPITSASHATWAEPRATASVPPAASTARAGVSAYLALWSTEAHADEAMPFSKDLVLSYSHSIPELRAEVRGRTSAITQVRAVAHLGRQWQFRDVRLFPTLDANVYFAQYTAAGVSTFDGASIEQNVVLCLEVDGSQVVQIVEFSNPAIVLANRESMSLLGSR
jgi:hypothetical protein